MVCLLSAAYAHWPPPLGAQQEQPSVRLLKHIIRCYLRLSDNPRRGADPTSCRWAALRRARAALTAGACRARDCLRHCFPELLRDPRFTECLRDDQTTRRWLQTLLMQLGAPEGAQGPPPTW